MDEEGEVGDEVFEEETQNEATERDIKTDNSPVVHHKTPIVSTFRFDYISNFVI